MRWILKPVRVWDESSESARDMWRVEEQTAWWERLAGYWGNAYRTFSTKEAAKRYLDFVESE